MTVRAKMIVQGIEGNIVTLQCDYSATPEDQSFCTATPWGEIRMAVTNPDAANQFAAGDAFYVDFNKVSPAT